MTARERLLAQEAYNSRSFPLITEEALAEVEREAVAATLAELRIAVERERVRVSGVPWTSWNSALTVAQSLIDRAGQP